MSEHHHCDCHEGHHHYDSNEESKYQYILDEYNAAPTEEEVAAAVKKITEEKVGKKKNKEALETIYSCLDLTSLKCTDNAESILTLTEEVNKFEEKYPYLKNVAAICVYPNFANIVSQSLEAESVEVACVSGGFPSSQTFSEVKIAETALALQEGATEIDIVLNIGKLLSGDYESLCDEIQELKDLCGDRTLKVILETGILRSAENIRKAAILSMYSGADFIKTSTGKEAVGATPEAAYIMCRTIKEYHAKTGRKIGFKAAGGISTIDDALLYYTIVEETLGKEWLDSKLFRIGTSRLAATLLNEITSE
ncbi:MAG: deoxyribose-phosphate aldolase [Bacteroidaceae bacterium]|nr:deoxyribose-phosphate aldolase [Bacteroidaceae bacterium]